MREEPRTPWALKVAMEREEVRLVRRPTEEAKEAEVSMAGGKSWKRMP
jgi:hypothetical protein